MTTRSPARITLGDFRDLIDIYKDASNPTDEQQSFTGLPFVTDVSAKIEQTGGNEREQEAFIKYEVTCHYMEDITTSMQITVTEGPFTADKLNIGEVQTVRYHGRPRYLILHCIKVD